MDETAGNLSSADAIPGGLSKTGDVEPASRTGLEVNTLHYGDNLDVLSDRKQFPDESIDLVYLDPPFNSDRAYNAFFKTPDGERSPAQIQAFTDTWTWGPVSDALYKDLVEGGAAPAKVADVIRAIREILGEIDLCAYLVMMAPRLVQLHRVLKHTGNLFLHCDPTASHYLKIMLDALFGARCFRSEIVWRRTGAHKANRGLAGVHDTILFYSRHETDFFFEEITTPYMRGHIESRYTQDPSGRMKFTSGGNVLSGPGKSNGESGKPWKGFDPSAKDRHWAVPGFLTEQMPPEFEKLGVLAKLDALHANGLIDIVEGNAWPTPVRYLEPGDGQPMSDIWAAQPYTEKTVFGTNKVIDADVQWLGPTDPERLGYPTQKPIGLLERIINIACPEKGVVLDPFCGCGTTVEAAHKLGRPWIGIDITYISIHLILSRMRGVPVKVLGNVPRDIGGARALFKRSALEFERWAVSLVDGQPNEKQVGDEGIDGIVRFQFEAKKIGRAVVSVKGGNQKAPTFVRDLIGTVANEKAEMGILILMDEATRGMVSAAAQAGSCDVPMLGKSFPKIQLFTVEELLEGKRPHMPTPFTPFVKAKFKSTARQVDLLDHAVAKKRRNKPRDEEE